MIEEAALESTNSRFWLTPQSNLVSPSSRRFSVKSLRALQSEKESGAWREVSRDTSCLLSEQGTFEPPPPESGSASLCQMSTRGLVWKCKETKRSVQGQSAPRRSERRPAARRWSEGCGSRGGRDGACSAAWSCSGRRRS